MDKFFKALFLFFLCCSYAFAQNTVKQAIIASGGNYSDPANKIKLFTYNPGTKQLSAFDSIPGRFARDIVVDEGIAYISADSMLYTYDLNTHKRKDSIVLNGLNRMHIHNNYLIVSRWYPATSNFIQILDKRNLNLVYNDNIVSSSTNGITVLKDTAYIAVNAFDSGKVAVISLSGSAPSFVKQITLDTLAKLTDDIFNNGNNLVTLSYPYGADYNTITSYNLADGKAKYDTMKSAMDGIVLLNNQLYANFGKGLQAYNIATDSFGAVVSNLNYYRGSYDSVNSNFYLIDINFTSNNKIYVINRNGQSIDTFEVGMSTEAVAFDYTNTSGIKESQIIRKEFISVYPNPSNGIINLVSEKTGRHKLLMKDITGRTVIEKTISLNSSIPEKLNIENLPKGIYLLSLINGNESSIIKIVKE